MKRGYRGAQGSRGDGEAMKRPSRGYEEAING